MNVINIVVERRRRDKINNWIVQLSKLIPECADIKHGQVSIAKVGLWCMRITHFWKLCFVIFWFSKWSFKMINYVGNVFWLFDSSVCYSILLQQHLNALSQRRPETVCEIGPQWWNIVYHNKCIMNHLSIMVNHILSWLSSMRFS